MNKGIRFIDEFKWDAVAQVVKHGYAVRADLHAAREDGLQRRQLEIALEQAPQFRLVR
jgi:hypothetical protein